MLRGIELEDGKIIDVKDPLDGCDCKDQRGFDTVVVSAVDVYGGREAIEKMLDEDPNQSFDFHFDICLRCGGVVGMMG